MINKLIATFCAWALAPLSMLFVMYLPVTLYIYFNEYIYRPDSFAMIGFILLVSYAITVIVGLPTHAVLQHLRKDKVSNYTLVGGTAILLWCALVLVSDGIPSKGFSQSQIIWFLVLMAHGLLVSTSFALTYKKVYALLTKPKPNLSVLA